MLKKILLLPVLLLLAVFDGIIKIVIKAECWVGGIAFLFLGICILMALVNQMWLQFGILTGAAVVSFIVLILSAEIQVMVELLMDHVRAI